MAEINAFLKLVSDPGSLTLILFAPISDILIDNLSRMTNMIGLSTSFRNFQTFYIQTHFTVSTGTGYVRCSHLTCVIDFNRLVPLRQPVSTCSSFQCTRSISAAPCFAFFMNLKTTQFQHKCD